MNLIRFNQHPVNVLSEMMEDFDRNWLRSSEARPMMPAVNISENEDGFVLELAAPGMQKADFQINLDNQVLTISSEKQDESEEKNEKYSRREFCYSSFNRSFTLPKVSTLIKLKQTIKTAF
ncbi:MAG: Hsp20/alpha crystallin family protein [Bacteroidales bacterium]|nr:Hsp20/alpha crystallin family protein [Bacteroidales bacterium]